MQELEVRDLNSNDKDSVKELQRWGTTTVLIQRHYNFSNIRLIDEVDLILPSGGGLIIDGTRYSANNCYSTIDAHSKVTPLVLY